LVFETSFAKIKDTELGGKLKAELSGIANWAIEGLRRLRAKGNRFTIGERGRKAQRELTGNIKAAVASRASVFKEAWWPRSRSSRKRMHRL
jgi:phage/plasmid-associated DNA primase